MNDELHRVLDGESDQADIADETRSELGSWERMLDAFRTSAPAGSAPAWLEQQVMAEIERLPQQGIVVRMRDWLLQPRSVRVSPLTAGLAAAGLAAILVWSGFRDGRVDNSPIGPTAEQPAEAVVYVQFVLEAPRATSVAVAGDFSAWEPTFALDDLDGDGVWTGRVPVQPGVHTYMFLIDGSEWETDPRADRYQDDGFGNRNAVLAVASGA